MFRELKYVFYLLVIFLFIFLTGKFYFSDQNKKNYYRSINSVDKNINIYSLNLPLLKNDTKNILIYKNDLEEFKKKRKKRFWEKLISN